MSPQDHYLLAFALVHGGRWEAWEPSFHGPLKPSGHGQFNFQGVPYLSQIGNMGVPVVTSVLREAILQAVEEWRLCANA